MRVLMTADPLGGVWTYALELCAGLRPLGVRIALATLGAPLSEEQREEVRQLGNVELHESTFRLEWMREPWRDVEESGAWLRAIDARYRPDVVHLNGYSHGALEWSAPVIVVGHSCVLSWFEAVRGVEAPGEWSRYRQEVSRGLRGAQALVAPTRAALAALERHHGPLPRGRAILNGRRASLFRPAAKEALVLSASRLWDEAKNAAVLERIAPRLSWPIALAGEASGPDGQSLTTGGCKRLGRLPQNELAEWMGRASLFVLPARYEPFGLSALEAALSGCALVLGDIPSLREVWGEAAVYVRPDDPEQILDILEALVADGLRRRDLAARAVARARELTPARMAQAYHGLYRELRAGARSAEEVSPCAS